MIIRGRDREAVKKTMASDKKKLFIKTWGCQMNVYDSRRMADVLAPLGYEPTDDPAGADMAILNTCHIREKATEKVFSDLGRIRAHKTAREAAGGKMVIAVAGCVAQAEGDIIMDRAPYVDMVFGPQAYHELPQMVMAATGERVVNTDFAAIDKFDALPQDTAGQGVCAFLSVQEGCDKFCTFCVVPYTRGAEFSRSVSQILNEAQRLIEKGARELTLLGQNVNAYHGAGPNGQDWPLARLIEAVAALPGVERIRYTTSHPRDMSDDLIAAHRDIPALMPFLHLPVQSGSNNILKAMNRKHEISLYYEIVDKLRAARPDIALSSDFIVGFPGETDQDFEDTMKLVQDIGFALAYSFKYSSRPGTPAAVMKGLLPERVKDERLQRLQAVLFKQQINFNQSMVGRILPVLFDGWNDEKQTLHGRTPWNQAVHVKGHPRLKGQTLDVEITKASQNSLSGDINIRDAA